ncbi:Queuosine salvage protein [Penicillium cinerascens]|uniref:Queuosine 5'-phosphate N-glycosylase/hydrolase n=1 Tax=Penicillium cinerascens TaxID=70096 RepID=A0A9W9JCQ7_9EURO|nr:Queuosine salvage protein [Penicillium cinerascens]KAJ5194638.1 Queuosine salvage protein [Penicillium cinerascens]
MPSLESDSDRRGSDEADPELVELLRQHLGLGGKPNKAAPPETKVLEAAQYIFDNSIDVALSPTQIKEAAETIWRLMQKKAYSTQTWSEHELHPQEKNESTVDFIFTMDLLNFSFWSAEKDESKRFCIEYRGRKWTGYWSLVAALQRALDEDIPITTPDFWVNKVECTDELLKYVFRSATDEEIPLFQERVQCLREAGEVLCNEFGGSFVNCIDDANYSAAGLVNLVAENFACFRDETSFNGKRVRLLKRAQILVADLWACFNGEDFGEFHDIDKITMFADYRIPQMLNQLGCLRYSPPLDSHIRSLKPLTPGSNWEIELRGTSIWCVELIKREIEKRHPEVKNAGKKGIVNSGPDENDRVEGPEEPADGNPHKTFGINAILIDFFLYDTMKSLEAEQNESVPHHRTRSIWY